MAQDTARYPWLKNYPPFAAWDMPLPAAPVYTLLLNAAEKFPDRPCMEFLGKRWTYAETVALAKRFAAGLQKHGVTKGTRIALLLPNAPYYMIAFCGALHPMRRLLAQA